MKSCGVIVEYNPFHNGHLYHLAEARKKSQADVLIAVMSGDFLQRGEPALVDKWTRTQMALAGGADLVVELPIQWAVQSADYFAQGAVNILQGLQCDVLCFGTEKVQADYEAIGALFVEKNTELQEKLAANQENAQSYPVIMARLLAENFPDTFTEKNIQPNEILGISYAKANAQCQNPMALLPIKRVGADYHDAAITKDTTFASATGIRKVLLAGETVSSLTNVLPETTAALLQNKKLVRWQDFWPDLHYQLLVTTPEKLKNIHDMSTGLENRLLAANLTATDFDGFMSALKTKRFTWTKLQRLLVYVLLQMTKEEISASQKNTYIRLLGMNEVGQKYLHEEKKHFSLPLITNVKQGESDLLALEIRASRLYNQLAGITERNDLPSKPIFFEKK